MRELMTSPVKQRLFYRFRTLVLLTALLIAGLHSRAQLVLHSPNTTGTFSDPVSIKLDSGFSSFPTSGQYFKAYIDNSGVLPLAEKPSNDRSYVITYTPRLPGIASPIDTTLTNAQVIASIQYVDGLGRPDETIQIKGSSLGRDVVQPFAYDSTGRETVKYLPYVLSSSGSSKGSYQSGALTVQAAFYNPSSPGASNIATTGYPYAQTRYELSPLNRVLEQGAAGADWQLGQHTQGTIYAASDSTSLSSGYWAQKYVVNTDGTYSGGATYGAGQLTVTVTHDENWTSADSRLGTTEEYTDKDGHMILRRTFNYNTATSTTEPLSTYYVYDDIGTLRYVLPPSMNPDSLVSTPNTTRVNNQSYHYVYDDQQRMIKKTLPGFTAMNMAYNKLDRLVMTSDSVQSTNLQWTVTKYDGLGRVAMTGLWTAGSRLAPSALQANIYAAGQWDTRNPADTVTGYTISSYPTTMTNVLSINYYDDYNIPHLPSVYDHHSDTSYTLKTQGLLTASKTAILNPDGTVSANMLWTVYYYDEYGRVVKTYKQHYLGGSSNYSVNNYDETTTSYNFTNAVTKTIRQHHTAAASGAVTLAMTDSLVYDHMGRLTQSWNQVNSDSKILLSQTDYNELGQATTKHLHSTDNGASFLQNVQYTYNERGWLKSSSAPLFTEQLKYNDGTTPQYNGNISQMLYNGTNSGNKTFSYTYDKVNRLMNAASTSSALDETLSYDVIGNIKTLSRSGVSSAALAYSYNLGGQLQAVTNSSSAFRSYGYDANGNATSDGGSKSINYNLLNLPRSVGSNIATYTYDAAGDKLQNTGSDGTWDYDNGIVYLNPVSNTGSTIQLIQTTEGRIVNNSGTYKYKYDLKDHLGNVRVTFDAGVSGAAETIQEDEYYSLGLRKPLYDNANGNHYLYNGKEVQTDLVNQYDFGTRFYDPVIGRWGTMDPLAEGYRRFSAYSYGGDNSIRFIDQDGMSWGSSDMFWGDFLDENGRKVGSDGKDDKKLYVIKTSKKTFDSDAPSDGITKDEEKGTENFIKQNNGNTSAFENNDIAYKNSVEIPSSADTRQSMVNIVNQDNGRGGTSDANNREYGGVINPDGTVTQSPAGPVANPLTNSNAYIDIASNDSQSSFHSHPSGNIIPESGANSIGGSSISASFRNAPSNAGGDIQNSRGAMNYVFSRGNGTVYIYNNTGVQATIPQKYFVTPKQ